MREILIAGLYNGIIGSIGATTFIIAAALLRSKLGI